MPRSRLAGPAGRETGGPLGRAERTVALVTARCIRALHPDPIERKAWREKMERGEVPLEQLFEPSAEAKRRGVGE